MNLTNIFCFSLHIDHIFDIFHLQNVFFISIYLSKHFILSLWKAEHNWPLWRNKNDPWYHSEQSTKKGTPFLRFPVSCCQAYIKANELSASKVPNAVTLTLVLSNVAIWLISRVPVFQIFSYLEEWCLIFNNLAFEICKFGCLALNLHNVYPQKA